MKVANERADEKFVEAYRACSLVEAQVIRLALEEEGHYAVIEGEMSMGYPPGWSTDPRVMVPECELDASHKIIDQIDHRSKSKFKLTWFSTAGVVMLAIAATALGGKAGAVCLFVASLFGLPWAYARIQRLRSRKDGEQTRCLACGGEIEESESACPRCGWTYQSGSSSLAES